MSKHDEDRLLRLVEAYRAEMERASSFDLAEREWQMVTLVRKLGLGRWNDRSVWKWMIAQFGGSSYEYIQRRHIKGLLGPVAEVLWRRIDAGLPLGTAMQLAKNARKKASKKHPRELRQAVEQEIATLAASGSRMSGHVQDEWDRVGQPSESISAAQPRPAERATSDGGGEWAWTGNEAGFWQGMRRALMRYAAGKLPSMPELEREQEEANLLHDLYGIFEMYQARWRRLEQQAAGQQQRVTRARLRDSCSALHIDLPRKRDDLDEYLKRANKQRRLLAGAYHPDKHGGSDEMVALYRAVNTAYDVIEQFVQEEKRNRDAARKMESPQLRVVRGGKTTG